MAASRSTSRAPSAKKTAAGRGRTKASSSAAKRSPSKKKAKSPAKRAKSAKPRTPKNPAEKKERKPRAKGQSKPRTKSVAKEHQMLANLVNKPVKKGRGKSLLHGVVKRRGYHYRIDYEDKTSEEIDVGEAMQIYKDSFIGGLVRIRQGRGLIPALIESHDNENFVAKEEDGTMHTLTLEQVIEMERDPLVGRSFKKKFPRQGIFTAVIESVTEKRGKLVYTVKYDDGDVDNMDRNEVLSELGKLAPKLKPLPDVGKARKAVAARRKIEAKAARALAREMKVHAKEEAKLQRARDKEERARLKEEKKLAKLRAKEQKKAQKGKRGRSASAESSRKKAKAGSKGRKTKKASSRGQSGMIPAGHMGSSGSLQSPGVVMPYGAWQQMMMLGGGSGGGAPAGGPGMGMGQFQPTSQDGVVVGKFWGSSLHLALQQVDSGVMVSGFTKTPQNTPGEAEASGQVKIGDVIVAVNGNSAGMENLDNVAHALKVAPRPVLVYFRRPMVEAPKKRRARKSTGEKKTPRKKTATKGRGQKTGPKSAQRKTAPKKGGRRAK